MNQLHYDGGETIADGGNIGTSSGQVQLLIGALFRVIILASTPLPSLFVHAPCICYFFSLDVGCLLLDKIMQSKAQSEAKFALGHAGRESNFMNADLNYFSLCCLRCCVSIKYLLRGSTDSLCKHRSCVLPGDLGGVCNDGNVAGIFLCGVWTTLSMLA